MFNLSSVQNIVDALRVFFDIALMWIIVYYAIKLVRNNARTVQIFKGVILILLIRGIATGLGLSTTAWLAGLFVNFGFLAIIIIFQPEIRNLLEKLGKTSVFTRISTLTGSERERLVDELVNAAAALSNDKVGALITIEQSSSLQDYIRTGSPMNSMVTSDVLRSLFSTNTPLHDGAVIIQGDRIACASAYFPPTNMDLPTRFGARHRAALGISEITDSITVVVSEETGRISIAENGVLYSMTKEKLKEYLFRVIIEEESDIEIANIKRRYGDVNKDKPEIVKVEDTSADDQNTVHPKTIFTKVKRPKPEYHELKIEEVSSSEGELKVEDDASTIVELESTGTKKKRVRGVKKDDTQE
jgi:diadenylate cyclase